MKRFLCAMAVVILLAGITVVAFGFFLPYALAGSARIDGTLTMARDDDGQWHMSWQQSRADVYRVEVLDTDGELLYRDFSWGQAEHLLPALPDRTLTIRVTPGVQLTTFLGQETRYSEDALEVRGRFVGQTLTVEDLQTNGDEKTVTVELSCPDGCPWEYQVLDQAGQVLDQGVQTGNQCLLRFGDGAIALPQEDAPYTLVFRSCQEEQGVLVYGPTAPQITITAQSLEYRQLDPVVDFTSKNTIALTWSQTRGSYYEVQRLDQGSGQWETLTTVDQDGARLYTCCLEPGGNYTYRVAALDDQGRAVTQSQELTVTGQDRTLYATIWPVKDLTAWSDPQRSSIAGTARTGTAYCVLEETGGMFGVRIGDETCYIDSQYCMINLPEYLGGLCSYSITNGTSSIFAVHGFPIENVTGTVIPGYEAVEQTDGTYLAPLLYPTARRLLEAAQAARDQGYRLKIYDSFRPYIATRQVYDLTSRVMHDPIADYTYEGVPKEEVDLPQPQAGWDYVSLGWLMTGNSYSQNSFLAEVGSTHNQGVALDLTLEDWDTGQELTMQSAMHDLSQYSVLPKNNDMANILQDIMYGAEFGGLVSEWWHFQDNITRGELTPPYVSRGVSAQCWMRDDTGWRYRGATGTYYVDQTVLIEGTEYTFDQDGYLVE